MDSVLIIVLIYITFLTGNHNRVLAHSIGYNGHVKASDFVLPNKTAVQSLLGTPGRSQTKAPNSRLLEASPSGSQDLPNSGAGKLPSKELRPRTPSPNVQQPAVHYGSFNHGEQQSGFSQLSQPKEQKNDVLQGFSIPLEQQPAGLLASSSPDGGVHNRTLNSEVQQRGVLSRSSNFGIQPAIHPVSSNTGQQRTVLSASSSPARQQQAVFPAPSNPGRQQQAVFSASSNPRRQQEEVLSAASNAEQQQAVLSASSYPWLQAAAPSNSSDSEAHTHSPAPGFSSPGSSNPRGKQRSVLPQVPIAQRQSLNPINPRPIQGVAAAQPQPAAGTTKAVANLPQYPQLPTGSRIFKYVNLTLKSFLGFALVSWDVQDSYLLNEFNCSLIIEYIGIGDCAPANQNQTMDEEIQLDQKIRSYELDNVVPWRTLAVTLKGETVTGNHVDHMTATVTTHEESFGIGSIVQYTRNCSTSMDYAGVLRSPDCTGMEPTGAVENIRTVSLQPESAKLAWDPPPCEERGGVLKHYTIERWPTAAKQKAISLTSTSEWLYIKPLLPYTEYNVEIAYVNSVDSGPVSQTYTFKTSQGPPSPPLVYNVTYDDVTIGIVIVPPPQPNGLVEEYHVQLSGGPKGLSDLYTPLSGTEYVIGKLQPNTTYSIKARARNAAGWSDWSHTIYVTTKEEARPIPQAVKQSLGNATCIGFYWVPPVKDLNAVSTYKITVSPNDQSRKFESSVDKSTNSFIQCGLTPFTLYSVTVSVMKDSGRLGQPLGARMWTEGSPPPKPQPPVIRKATSSTITVELHPVSFNSGPITSYEIRLLELHHNHSKRVGHGLEPFSDPELQDKAVSFDAPQFHSPAGLTISATSSIRNSAEVDYTRKNGPDIRPVGKRSTRVRSKQRRVSNREQLAADEPTNNYMLVVIALPDSVVIHGHNSTQIQSWVLHYLRQRRSSLQDHQVAGGKPPLLNPDINRNGSDVFNKTGSYLSHTNGSNSNVHDARTITRDQNNGTYLQKTKDFHQFELNSSVKKDSTVTDSGKGDWGQLEGVANHNVGIRVTAGGLAGQASGPQRRPVIERTRRALGNPPGVLWLELPASGVYEPTLITLGDDKMYYGRRNLPLKPDTEYAVVYVVKSTVVDVTKHSFAYAKSSVHTLMEQKEEDDDSDVWLVLLIIMAIILLVLFLLLGFFVIRYMIMHRRPKGQQNDELSDYDETDDEESDEEDYDNYHKPLQVTDSTDFGQAPMKNTSDLESFFNPIHSLGQPRYINSMRDNVMYNNNAYPSYASRHSSADAITDPRNNDGNNSAVRPSSSSNSHRTWTTTDSDPTGTSFGSSAVIDISISIPSFPSFPPYRRCKNHCCCNYSCSIVSSDSNDSSITCDISSSIAAEELPESTSKESNELYASGCRSSGQVCVGPEAIQHLDRKSTNSSSFLDVSSQQLEGSSENTEEPSDITESWSLCSVNESISSNIFGGNSKTSVHVLCEPSATSLGERQLGVAAVQGTSTRCSDSPRTSPRTGQSCECNNDSLGPNRVDDMTDVLYNRNNSNVFEEDDVACVVCRGAAGIFDGCRVDIFLLDSGSTNSVNNDCNHASDLPDSNRTNYSQILNLPDSSRASYSQDSILSDSSRACYSLLPNICDSMACCSLSPNVSDIRDARNSLIPNQFGSSHDRYRLVPNKSDASHTSYSLVPNQFDPSRASYGLIANLSYSSHDSYSLVPLKSDSSQASYNLIPNLPNPDKTSYTLVPNQSDLSHASCSQATQEKPNSHPTEDVDSLANPQKYLQNERSICLNPGQSTMNTNITDCRLGTRLYPVNWNNSSIYGVFLFRICQHQTRNTTIPYNEESYFTTTSFISRNCVYERVNFANYSINNNGSPYINTEMVYKTNMAARKDYCNQHHTRYTSINGDLVEDTRYNDIDNDNADYTKYAKRDDDIEGTRHTNIDGEDKNTDDDDAEDTRYQNTDNDDVEDTRSIGRNVWKTDADDNCRPWLYACENFNNNSSNNKSGNNFVVDNMRSYCNFDDDDDDIEDIVLDGDIPGEKVDDEEEENDDSKVERDITKKSKYTKADNEVVRTTHYDSEDDISSVYISEKNDNNSSSDEEEENTTKDGDNDRISTPLHSGKKCETKIESRVSCLREGNSFSSQETMGITAGNQGVVLAKSNMVSSLSCGMPINAGSDMAPSDTIIKDLENGLYNIHNGDTTQTRTSTEQRVPEKLTPNHRDPEGLQERRQAEVRVRQQALKDEASFRTENDRPSADSFVKSRKLPGRKSVKFMFWRGDRINEKSAKDKSLSIPNAQSNTTDKNRKVPLETRTHNFGRSVFGRTRGSHGLKERDVVSKEINETISTSGSVYESSSCADLLQEEHKDIDRGPNKHTAGNGHRDYVDRGPDKHTAGNGHRDCVDRGPDKHTVGNGHRDYVDRGPDKHTVGNGHRDYVDRGPDKHTVGNGHRDYVDRGPDKHTVGNKHRDYVNRKSSLKKRWFHVFHSKIKKTKEEVNQADVSDNNLSTMNIDTRNDDVSFKDAKNVNSSKADTDNSGGKANWLRENETPEKKKQNNEKRMKLKNIFSVFVKDNDENENKPREGRRSLAWQRGGRDRSSREVDNGSRLSRRPRAAGLRPTARSRRSGRALSFKDEFRALERYRHHVMRSMRFDTALRHPDRNRFGHILPPEHTRVNVEITRPGEPDYYNASYMDLKSDIRYIVAQSPFSPAMVSDFWRLVLQNGAQTIVMMSRCVEMGVVKCVQYWAESGIFADGPVIVQTVGHQQYADFAIRTLKVSSSTSPEVTVTHFEFQTWPASDVPDDPVPLLDLRYRVRRSHGNQETPILVHCDSGSAQSAVFIAVDLLIEQYGRDGSVNAYGFVKKMRKSRPTMIRSLRQYRFIFECLFEEFQAGDTVLRLDLADKYRALSASNPQTGFSYLMDEFRMLTAFTPDIHPDACAAGPLPENAVKNVDHSIVPPDFYRPYLNVRGDPAVDGYINAVFVDGLHRHHEFLVTQTPLNSTVYAFWRMVYDYQVQTIVQLGTFNGHTQAQYIPMTGSRRFEYLLVELVNVGLQRSITVRNLKLCAETMAGLENRAVRHMKDPSSYLHIRLVVDLGEGGGALLYKDAALVLSQKKGLCLTPTDADLVGAQFQLAHWQDDSATAFRNRDSSSNSRTEIIDLLDLVMSWQTVANRRTRPIVVCCTNGATLCGVFCCSAVLCERLREDKEVDLYHTVKHIKRRRPQFVADFDQYQFLHLVLLEYIDTVLNNEGDVMDGGEGVLSSSEESESDVCVKDSADQTELDCVTRDIRDASCEAPDALICHEAWDLKTPRSAFTNASCRQKCYSAGVLGRLPRSQASGAAGPDGCGCEATSVRKVLTCEEDGTVEDCWCSSAPVRHERRPQTYQRRNQWRESPRFEARREVCSPTAQVQPSRPRYHSRRLVGQDRMETVDPCTETTMRVTDCSPCAAQRDSSVRFQPSVTRPRVVAEGRPCTETLVERCYLSPLDQGQSTSGCGKARPRGVSSPSPVNDFDESSSSSEFDVSLNLV